MKFRGFDCQISSLEWIQRERNAFIFIMVASEGSAKLARYHLIIQVIYEGLRGDTLTLSGFGKYDFVCKAPS